MIAPIPRREAHIAAIITPVPGFDPFAEPPVGSAELELLAELEELDGLPLLAEDGDEVTGDGNWEMDTGEVESRHVASLDMPTSFWSELPP